LIIAGAVAAVYITKIAFFPLHFPALWVLMTLQFLGTWRFLAMFVDNAWAMSPPPNANATAFDLIMGYAPLILVVVIFYWLIFRPQQKKQQETRDMIAALKDGDAVMTTGGIYGTIAKIKDDIIVLQLAENVKIKINRNYVAGIKDHVEVEKV
jgi:preprotein translocase subunit YajC